MTQTPISPTPTIEEQKNDCDSKNGLSTQGYGFVKDGQCVMDKVRGIMNLHGYTKCSVPAGDVVGNINVCLYN